MSIRNVLSRVKSVLQITQIQNARTFLNKPSARFIYNQNCLCYPRRVPGSSVKNSDSPSLHISEKYKMFDDKDAVIIQNTSEELLADQSIEDEDLDEFEGLNLQRGINGVFEIDELVELLHQENARDIFVVAVPPSIHYADYICIATGRSLKHNFAIADFIRRLFKRKRNPKDIIPKVEGKEAKEWIALDLGNIVLHIFNDELRELYDLELLWSVGSEYDDQSRKYSEMTDVMESHRMFLDDLEPADDDEPYRRK